MSYWGYAPYVSVAERRKKAEKAAAKAKKAGANFSPIAPSRGAIAKTFWGKAWCDNLEQYSDYESRLPRGRTYVRNGSVIDLQVSAGEVQAQVMGSSLYTVKVSVQAVPVTQWKAICTDCATSIDSLVELLQGKLAQPVMARICTPKTGLFPAPKDIQFSCSCPDWASMCKHVAAVLYGVGNRLDQQPDLLFSLRQVDAQDLVAQAGSGLPKATHGLKGPAASKVLDDSALGDVFGLEMDELEAMPVQKPKLKPKPKPQAKPVKQGAKPAPTKPAKTSKAAAAKPAKAPVKTTPVKAAPAKPATAKRKAASKAIKAVTVKTSKAPTKAPSVKAVPAKSSASKTKTPIATKKPKPKAVAR